MSRYTDKSIQRYVVPVNSISILSSYAFLKTEPPRRTWSIAAAIFDNFDRKDLKFQFCRILILQLCPPSFPFDIL